MKINIDELKCKKGEQKLKKKDQVTIYEKLVFEKKNEASTAPEKSDNDEFVLKENIYNHKDLTKSKSPEKNSSKEKENIIESNDTAAKLEKPRKKVACFAASVETITVEGEKETEVLATKEPGPGARTP